MKTISVCSFWDNKAAVWVASSDDLPGLATEADAMDDLVGKLKIMIPELLDANGYPHGEEIPFKLIIELTAIASPLC